MIRHGTVGMTLGLGAALLCGRAFPETAAVDATTMDRKLLMGYQGWFACPGDGSPADRWVHWFREGRPVAANLTVDMWPDTSELDPDELFDSRMIYPNGLPARLYSAHTEKTVVRHFLWMREHGLDGVMLQRFTSELRDPAVRAFRDRVAQNVRAGAERHGRVFNLMYDVSGHPEAGFAEDLRKDWVHLVDTLKITESPRYLRHRGRPVLAIWGLGFTDRPGTARQALDLVEGFTSKADPARRVTLMGGVPTHWRTLDRDSKTDPLWAEVYRSFDVLSPWAVGRYADEAGADRFKETQIVPDLAETKAKGIGYMPVVFPGFSWYHIRGGPVNQIPRRGGRLYWRQVFNAVSAGCTMVYGAMFDEVDEGTAMYKMAPTSAEMPAVGVALDADGYALPSDWYLRLAGEATKAVRGDTPPSPTLPLTLPQKKE